MYGQNDPNDSVGINYFAAYGFDKEPARFSDFGDLFFAL